MGSTNTQAEFVAFAMQHIEIFMGELTLDQVTEKIKRDFCETAYVLSIGATREVPTNPNAAHLSRVIPDAYTSQHQNKLIQHFTK